MDAAQLFKELVWDNLVKAALRRVFAAVPWLGWGPIGYLVTYYVTKYADILYELLHEYIDFQLIVFKRVDIGNKFADASVNLRMVAEASGLMSAEYLEARRAQKEAFAKFVNFSITPNKL